MIVTEAVAKTKACPFAHNFGASQEARRESIKRSTVHPDDVPLIHPNPTCVGSRCMAWDFLMDENEALFLDQVKQVDPEFNGNVYDYPEEKAKAHGWYKLSIKRSLWYRKRDMTKERGQCLRVISVTPAD